MKTINNQAGKFDFSNMTSNRAEEWGTVARHPDPIAPAVDPIHILPAPPVQEEPVEELPIPEQEEEGKVEEIEVVETKSKGAAK